MVVRYSHFCIFFDAPAVSAPSVPKQFTGPDPDDPGPPRHGTCSWWWNPEVRHETCEVASNSQTCSSAPDAFGRHTALDLAKCAIGQPIATSAVLECKNERLSPCRPTPLSNARRDHARDAAAAGGGDDKTAEERRANSSHAALPMADVAKI